MQTYLSDIIPKIQRFSRKLDELTLLTNQHWVVIDDITKNKYVYIFRGNNELLVSSDGKVEKGRWEYLGNNSLLIDIQENSYLYKHGFFDKNVLALKVDGKEEYVFLVNENKYDGELNSIDKVADFLSNNYLDSNIQKTIDVQYKIQNSSSNPHQKKDAFGKWMGYGSSSGCVISIVVIILFLLLSIFVKSITEQNAREKIKREQQEENFKLKEERKKEEDRIRFEQWEREQEKFKNPTYVTAKGIITDKNIIRGHNNNGILRVELIVDGKCFTFRLLENPAKEIGDYVEIRGQKHDASCFLRSEIIK